MPPEPRPVLICNVGGTLCTEFRRPIPAAVGIVRRFGPRLSVHYLTARPPTLRATTLDFLARSRLPSAGNLHLCPPGRSPLQHKSAVMSALAGQHRVVLSIGDRDEDAQASQAAGIRFVRVDPHQVAAGWMAAQAILEAATAPR